MNLCLDYLRFVICVGLLILKLVLVLVVFEVVLILSEINFYNMLYSLYGSISTL